LAYVSLLGTASGTTTALTGDIGKAWNTPYDLLVRPSGEVSKLERTKGLVSPNFISSIGGGITGAQLNSIRKVKGVSVAAPIAVVGYTTIDYTVYIPNLAADVRSLPFAVIRVGDTDSAEDGLAHYSATPYYLVWARHGSVTGSGLTQQFTYDGNTITCNGDTVFCEAGTEPSFSLTIPIPVMIAGIDPAAEARLAGLDKAMTSGRPLPATNGQLKVGSFHGSSRIVIPVITSTQSFISESVQMQASVTTDSAVVMSGKSPSRLTGWSTVYRKDSSVQSLYTQVIRQEGPVGDLANVVTPGQVHYRELSPTHLRAETVPADVKELLNPNCVDCEQLDTPPDASDTWYRPLKVSSRILSRSTFGFKVLGHYDPGKIPGFNFLAGGNLSAYAPPEALLKNGKKLLPSRNIAGYITSPPLILSTLAGAQYFADTFTGGSGVAYISAIRVRVSGTAKPSDAAQAKLTSVAQAIEQRTGLKVSLVQGSSPLPVRVSLAKGKFGTPALTVTEYWGEEGAAITFFRGVNTESLVLFLLTIGVVLVLVAVVGQLAARRRRKDFALLRAIGWPLAKVVRLALSEMLLLGAAVGATAALLAIGVTRIVDPAIPVPLLLAVIPLVAIMAVAAPLPALLDAARSSVSTALRRPGRVGRVRIRSVRTLAVRDLLGPWRMESILCAASSSIGSGLVGAVVLVVGGFAGHLGPTTLGRYLAAQVGPLDIVLIGIAIVAGAGASATLLSLAYLERQVEFSTLRAVGWPRGSVTAVVAIQALVLGLGGGLVAAAAITVGGVAIGAPVAVAISAPVLSIAVALVTTAGAMTGTISMAYRLGPAEALRSG
jgi:ABC-type antimicrobial peptide transport system permease subunit